MKDQDQRRADITVWDVKKLASHAMHYGNCPYDSWNEELTVCSCGLFQLLTKLEKRGLVERAKED